MHQLPSHSPTHQASHPPKRAWSMEKIDRLLNRHSSRLPHRACSSERGQSTDEVQLQLSNVTRTRRSLVGAR